MASPLLMVTDTSYLCFRAFHALPTTLRGASGQPANAVRGVLDTIARLIDRYGPTHLACAWDRDWRPQWRVDLLPSYKTHRIAVPGPSAGDRAHPAEEMPEDLAAQFGPARDVLEAAGLVVIGADDAEADDVMGTLAQRFAGRLPVLLVSGDRDFSQLVDDTAGIALLAPAGRAGGWRTVREADILSDHGVAPDTYVALAALRGDPSDGIPGVGGIGAKTGAQLLGHFGDLPSVRRAAHEVVTGTAAAGAGGLTARRAAAIDAAGDYLDVAERVITIRRDLPLGVGEEDLRLPAAPPDPSRWASLIAEWGAAGPAGRLTAALAGRAGR